MYIRRLFSALALFTLLFSFTPLFITASAAPDFDVTIIRGTITGPDGLPFKKADVVISCDGKTKNAKTNNQGKFYEIFAGKNTCEAGDTATVTASKDGVSGSASGVIELRRDGRIVDLNFSVFNFNVNVPEFGLLTGFFTAAGSVAVFLKTRKFV